MNNEVEINSTEVEFVTKNGVKINGLSNIDNNHDVHYLIYKVTNLVNGMYYIGQHQTKNPCDEYMGSGLMLENAKNKYGIEKFVKTIMFDFATRDEMLKKEIELVQPENCYHNNPMCYNLAVGGQVGNLGPEVSRRISEAVTGEKNGMYGKKLSKETLKKISDKLKGHPNYTHKGWHQSDDAKKRISDKSKGKKLSMEEKAKIREARLHQKNLNLCGMLNKRWYYNPHTGEECAFNVDDIIDSEWVRGRKPLAMKGKIYCTNGVKDLLVDSIYDIPAGYHRGRKTKQAYTESRNKKISEKLRGRKVSDETCQKIRASIIGRHWYNNGIKERQTFICPDGWTKGKLKRRNS